MRNNLPVTGIEVELDGNATLVSYTDPQGAILWVNRDFIQVSASHEQSAGIAAAAARSLEQQSGHLVQTAAAFRLGAGAAAASNAPGQHFGRAATPAGAPRAGDRNDAMAARHQANAHA